MVAIDRGRVRNAFSSHAGEYDAHAGVQKVVIARFMDGLAALSCQPKRVLDIGAGTGALLGRLGRLYPAADLVGVDLASGMCVTAREKLAGSPAAALVVADAEALPFGAASFDLVVSTSTYQWLDHLDRAFADALRVTTGGGWFSFALFGERTLQELRTSYRAAWERAGRGAEERTHTFPGAHEVEAALVRAGFAEVRVKSELEIERHPDVTALLKSVRRIGAGTAAPVKSRGLSERRVMLDMMEVYLREYGAGGGVPATYEIVFGVGRKPVRANS